MDASGLYHAGLIVDDLDAARASLAAAAGYRWTAIVEQDAFVVQTPAGEERIPLRLCFSTTAPYLELVQSVPGTLWTPTDSGVHHLGYWSDDVTADCDALAANGMTVEAWSELDGLRLFAYCKAPSGPRIELVHRSFAPILQGWIADVVD